VRRNVGEMQGVEAVCERSKVWNAKAEQGRVLGGVQVENGSTCRDACIVRVGEGTEVSEVQVGVVKVKFLELGGSIWLGSTAGGYWGRGM